MDVKQHLNIKAGWELVRGGEVRAQEFCESGGGRPGFPVPNKPTVSVDVKQHFNNNKRGGGGRIGGRGEWGVLSGIHPAFHWRFWDVGS